MKKIILLTCSFIVIFSAGCGPSSEELAVTMVAQTDEAATQTRAAVPTDTQTPTPSPSATPTPTPTQVTLRLSSSLDSEYIYYIVSSISSILGYECFLQDAKWVNGAKAIYECPELDLTFLSINFLYLDEGMTASDFMGEGTLEMVSIEPSDRFSRDGDVQVLGQIIESEFEYLTVFEGENFVIGFYSYFPEDKNISVEEFYTNNAEEIIDTVLEIILDEVKAGEPSIPEIDLSLFEQATAQIEVTEVFKDPQNNCIYALEFHGFDEDELVTIIAQSPDSGGTQMLFRDFPVSMENIIFNFMISPIESAGNYILQASGSENMAMYIIEYDGECRETGD